MCLKIKILYKWWILSYDNFFQVVVVVLQHHGCLESGFVVWEFFNWMGVTTAPFPLNQLRKSHLLLSSIWNDMVGLLYRHSCRCGHGGLGLLFLLCSNSADHGFWKTLNLCLMAILHHFQDAVVGMIRNMLGAALSIFQLIRRLFLYLYGKVIKIYILLIGLMRGRSLGVDYFFIWGSPAWRGIRLSGFF